MNTRICHCIKQSIQQKQVFKCLVFAEVKPRHEKAHNSQTQVSGNRGRDDYAQDAERAGTIVDFTKALLMHELSSDTQRNMPHKYHTSGQRLRRKAWTAYRMKRPADINQENRTDGRVRAKTQTVTSDGQRKRFIRSLKASSSRRIRYLFPFVSFATYKV